MPESRLNTEPSLQRLSDSKDFDIAENEPDIRGWDVVLSDGTTIGEVEDLFIDTSTMKARYLDVELDRKALGLDDKRHALVPIERADLDTDNKHVLLRGLDRQAVLQLQDLDVNQARGWNETTPKAERTDKTRLTRSAEELRIGKRMVQAGEVRVGKHVETDRVTENVARDRERVTFERRPASPGASASPQMGADEIVIPVMQEEIVVEKRAVVKEELVIGKERVTEQEQVDAELRREEFDIKGADDIKRPGDIKGAGDTMRPGDIKGTGDDLSSGRERGGDAARKGER
jgi:uncharacterized protein (TIGR02271 family)